jgi:AraC-like DNA-binding protein
MARKTAAVLSTLVPRVLRFLRTRGVDTVALVERLHLPRDAERRDAVAVVPEDFEAIVGAGAHALGEPLLALHLPALLEPRPRDKIGELVRASPTLGEAIVRVVRYASLFYTHLAYACERQDGELVVRRWVPTGTSKRYDSEYALAAMLWHVRAYCGARVAPRRVFFAHVEAGVDAVREFFGTDDIAFGRTDSGVAFALADADRALDHDMRLGPSPERQAGDGFVAMIEACVRAALADGTIDAPAIAQRLHLSSRALHDRLDEHGTTFVALVEGVRRDTALDDICDRSMALDDVARRAGFSDRTAFDRAFERWTGRPPGELRRAGGMMTAQEILLDELGCYYLGDEIASVGSDFVPTIPRRAATSVARMSRHAGADGRAPLVELLNALRDDRQHRLHSRIAETTLIGWTDDDDAWRSFQMLATAMIAGLQSP